MTTIVIERGIKTAECWTYLVRNNQEFTVERLYDSGDDFGYAIAFDITDPGVAVECALRFS